MLAALGLDWPDLFPPEPPRSLIKRSASKHVLAAIKHGTRWMIMTHRFGADDELALAVELLEHVLPARYAVRDRLRTRHGEPIPWDEFPFTEAFMIAAARKLGVRLGQKRARRLCKLLWDANIEDYLYRFKRLDGSSRPGFAVFNCSSLTFLGKPLACRSISAATSTVLSATGGLSRASDDLFDALVYVLGHEAASTRAPPAAGARPWRARTSGIVARAEALA